MASNDDEDLMQMDEEGREPGRLTQVVWGSSDIHHHHYHAPVHHIERAYNPNFGTNYGLISQNTYSSTPSVHWGGGPPPAIAGTVPYPIPVRADLTSLLNPILDASHTRNLKLSPPNSQCFPGTREKIFTDVRTWASSDLEPTTPHGYWIFGYAGCGKSAIAQSIAQYFARQKLLAASFFFFRGSGDRSRVVRFAATIASQLAAAIPELGPIIEAALKANPGLSTTATSSLISQFHYLIYDAIIAVAGRCRAPYLIVLDGVDECADREEMAAFIQDLIEFFNQHPLTPLRFLVTSRVEDHLHQVLHSSSQIQLLNLVNETSDADIAAALDVAITNAKRGRLFACDESWPPLWVRQRLVKHIGGSFIFMTTIIKHLFDTSSKDGLTPMDRLRLVLSMEANFDDLYKEILTPWQHLRHFHSIIRTIALAFEPLTIAHIADIVKIGTADVVNVLINLHAIIQVPGDDRTKVTLWHTSLRDFLCTKHRAGPFFADPTHDGRMGLRCIYLADPCVQSPVFQYSCRFAVKHLSRLLVEKGDLTDELIGALRTVKSNLDKPLFSGGVTALAVACSTEDWPLVHALVNANVNLDIEMKSVYRDNMYGYSVRTPLHAACVRGLWNLVHLLLDNGADPNFGGTSGESFTSDRGLPLAFACYHRNIKLVTKMLACGADPNQTGTYWQLRLYLGSQQFQTALHAACAGGSIEIVSLLLANKANPNLRGNYWNTPLHDCASSGYGSAALVLLENGADPNAQDDGGRTPLHAACSKGHVGIVKLLLRFKANAGIWSNADRTALELAQDGGHEAVVQMLRRHGVEE